MTPRFLHDDAYLLSNERGVTLLELLATAAILSLLIITVYIGVMFGERMSVRNYRDRVATLIASGELDRQYFINRYNAFDNQQMFDLFSGREVVIDHIGKNAKLLGALSVTTRAEVEHNGLQQYPYNVLIARVEWKDPLSKEVKFIQLREDYYIKLGP